MTAITLLTRRLPSLSSGAAACRKPPAPANSTLNPAATSGARRLPDNPRPVSLPAASRPPRAAEADAGAAPDVLARVNGEAVKKVDFDLLIKNMELGAGSRFRPERRDEIIRGALDQLVTYTVLSQETQARKVDGHRRRGRRATSSRCSRSFRTTRLQEGARRPRHDARKLRTDTRIDLIINKMMEAEVAQRRRGASDAEAQGVLRQEPGQVQAGRTVRASHILLRVDEKADAATKKKARAKIEAVLKRAKAGEDFAELAKENSADGSAAAGRRPRTSSRGPDGAGVRPGRVRAQARRDQRHRHDAVRLPHHQGDRAQGRGARCRSSRSAPQIKRVPDRAAEAAEGRRVHRRR